jgi:hypothetical protein
MIDMRDDRALASEIVAVGRNAVMKVERIPTHKCRAIPACCRAIAETLVSAIRPFIRPGGMTPPAGLGMVGKATGQTNAVETQKGGQRPGPAHFKSRLAK